MNPYYWWLMRKEDKRSSGIDGGLNLLLSQRLIHYSIVPISIANQQAWARRQMIWSQASVRIDNRLTFQIDIEDSLARWPCMLESAMGYSSLCICTRDQLVYVARQVQSQIMSICKQHGVGTCLGIFRSTLPLVFTCPNLLLRRLAPWEWAILPGTAAGYIIPRIQLTTVQVLRTRSCRVWRALAGFARHLT